MSVGRYEPIVTQVWETAVTPCDCCGQVVARRLWLAEVDGRGAPLLQPCLRGAVPSLRRPEARRVSEPLVEWRSGVTTRLVCGASTGAAQLCVIEQWCDPGHGAPTHTHHEVEEVILVRRGDC